MNSVSITVSPVTIGASSTLSFSVVLGSGTDIVTGNIITFTIPSPGSFTPSTTVANCLCTSGSITATTCTITANQVSASLTVTSASISAFIIKVSNFINPPSTTPITGVTATLTTAGGVTIQSLASLATISSFQPDVLTSASITPQAGAIIGATGQTITISMVIKDAMISGDLIVITFPYWNPNDSVPSQMVTSSTPTCIGTTLNAVLTCSFSSASRQLTVSNLFSTSQAVGTTLTFTMNSITNPYNAYPKTGFTISTTDSVGGQINSLSTASLTVTNLAALTSCSIQRADGITTVDTQSEVVLIFTNPFPSDPTCIARIYFPAEMQVSNAAITSITEGDLFSGTTQVSSTNTVANYIEVAGCTHYYTSTANAMFIQTVLNAFQVMTTSSFQVFMYYVNGGIYYNIGSCTSGMNFNPTSLTTGNINSFTLTAVTSSVVQATTTYNLCIQPLHYISSTSQLVVQFPTGITLTSQGACTLSSTSGGIVTSPTACVVAANTLTITNPFGAGGSFTAGAAAFCFTFTTGGTNPASVQDAGTFTVSTYNQVAGVYDPVDTSTFTNVFTPTAAVLTASVITVSSFVTSTNPSCYTLSITPQKSIPAGGQVSILFPTDVSLSGSTVASCKMTITGQTQVTENGCTIAQTVPPEVLVSGAFASGFTPSAGTSIQFYLCNFINPRTTATTASFDVQTEDSAGNAIEAVSSGVTTAMTSTSSMTAFAIAPVSGVNGASTQYKISMTSGAALQNGDQLTVIFPSTITLPSPMTCTVGTSVTAVTCSLSGANQLTASFTFNGGALASGTGLNFLVNGVTNQPSTAPSAVYSGITLKDSSGNSIQSYTTPTITTTDTTPATVTTKALIQSSSVINAAATYTIQYTTIDPMTTGSAYLITYPNIVTVPSSFTTCQAVYSGVTYPMTCVINSGSSTISMTGLNSAIPAGSQVQLIFGPITNPSSSQSTASFTATSYSSAAMTYSYDNIPSGLTPNYLCTFPCQTCVTGTPTSCTSCYTNTIITNLNYLYSSTCISACPAQYYSSSNVCVACMAVCATCTTSTTCATCTTGGAYPYLYNKVCLNVCPAGTYASGSTSCQACNSNCPTCSGSSTNCLSCNTGYYLYSGQCVTSCPSGYLLYGNTCTACTSPCNTCLSTITQCSSCQSGYYTYGATCVASCPSGTVLDVASSTCMGCDPNCQTCSSSNTDVCLVCGTGFILFNNTCLTSCPTGYNPILGNTQCQIIPVVIKPGSTILQLQINTTNYYQPDTSLVYFPFMCTQAILAGVGVGSYFKDKMSHPLSNIIAIWGPIEMIAYGTQVFLAYGYEIEANESPVINQYNVSANVTTFGRLLSSTSAANGAAPVVFYGTIIGFIFYLLTNVLFVIFFFMFLYRDTGYRDHDSVYPWTSILVTVFSSSISFKISRLYYSKFFGFFRFSVNFANPKRMHMLLNILTIMNIVLTILPIVFVDIYGLSKYSWGTQFYIIIIETLIFSLVTLVLSIIEFRSTKNGDPVITNTEYDTIKDQSHIEHRLVNHLEERLKSFFGGHNMGDLIEQMKETMKMQKQQVDTAGNTKGLIDNDIEQQKPSKTLGDQLKPIQENVSRQLHTHTGVGTEDIYGNANPINGYDPYFNNCYAMCKKGPIRVLPKSQTRKKIIQCGENAIEDDDDSYAATLAKKEQQDADGLNSLRQQETNRDLLGLTMAETQQLGASGQDQSKLTQQQKEQLLKQQTGDKQFGDKQQIVDSMKQKVEEEKKQINELGQVAEVQSKLEESDQKLNNSAVKSQLQNSLKKEDQQNITKQTDANQNSPQKSQTSPGKFVEDEVEEQFQEGNNVVMDENGNYIQDENGLNTSQQIGTTSKIEQVAGQTFKNQKELEEQILNEQKNQQNSINKQNTQNQNLDKDQQQQMENEISSTLPDEMGEPDSDDDNEKRIQNMRNPDKRRFNENDVLGDFERDERGNITILQDKNGNLVDKNGNIVNEKGYLINKKGDVLENLSNQKVFDKSELDERGELPPPFNLEKFNFNPHDIRGYFNRDKNGNEIIGKPNQQGIILDKLGRMVNQSGYLVDKQGHIVDKRGRRRLHGNQLNENGNLPPLFNYKGRRYDIRDIIGDLDKDRKGNYIIRRDKNNNPVDKKGRRINEKGYLIDKNGNVINSQGAIIFENVALSKDGEIPKLFPFAKFDLDSITGDYEQDPLGNPILQRDAQGNFRDNQGRLVNQKGYLIDDEGNIKNKRNYKVFGKRLLGKNGDIPKVFRAGLLRKDTTDSINNLIEEIDAMAKKQEETSLLQSSNKKKQHESQLASLAANKINEALNEDEDDENDKLMREIDEMARGNKKQGSDDGGNTSFDSKMEDTPSNYNDMNQRFVDENGRLVQMPPGVGGKNKPPMGSGKKNGKQNLRGSKKGTKSDISSDSANILPLRNRIMSGEGIDEGEYGDETEDGGQTTSQYANGLPNTRIRKGKKKRMVKKKKGPNPLDEITERDLEMARAYGGMPQATFERLLQEVRKRDAERKELKTQQSFYGQPQSRGGDQTSKMRPNFPTTQLHRKGSDSSNGWDNIREGNFIMPKASQANISTNNYGTQDNRKAPTKKNGSTMRVVPQMMDNNKKKNNFMGSQSNFRNGKMGATGGKTPQNYDPAGRKLSFVANSVSGFYRDPSISDNQSRMRSTHESNLAKDLQNNKFKKPNQEGAQLPGGIVGQLASISGGNNSARKQQPREEFKDPEWERLYGQNRGLDITMSDWDEDSQVSGSMQSQLTGMNPQRVKKLESIYLQRLEPASKRTGQMKKRRGQDSQDKARFRVMHHRAHDEPEWHVDEENELQKYMADNSHSLKKTFQAEFSQGARSSRKEAEDGYGPNIFHGNLSQYKEKHRKIIGADLGM